MRIMLKIMRNTTATVSGEVIDMPRMCSQGTVRIPAPVLWRRGMGINNE